MWHPRWIATEPHREEQDWPRRITSWRVLDAPESDRHVRLRRRGCAPSHTNPTRFDWHERAVVAADRPPRLVARVIATEIRDGRVESNGNGKVPLRAGALPDDVVRALGLFVD